jgi:hypothetical protein
MRYRTLLLVVLAVAHSFTGHASPKPLVGIYYFDGWADRTAANFHVKTMPADYPQREPLSGWYDDTPEAMHRQVLDARSAGTDFFLFDWYDVARCGDKDTTDKTLNTALALFKSDRKKRGMKYALLYVNEGPFSVPQSNWDVACRKWVKEDFTNPNYQRIDNRPLFVVYNDREMEKTWGGPPSAAIALARLRQTARDAGLPGLYLMVCATPGPTNGWNDLGHLAQAGYDAFTGYNYAGLAGTRKGSNPYERLVKGNVEIWDAFAADGRRPYVPVVTDGWDSRPWGETEFWYERSPAEFESFVELALKWWRDHPKMHVTGERPFILIEAWNELGEGSYIMPTRGDGDAYLKALSRALRH